MMIPIRLARNEEEKHDKCGVFAIAGEKNVTLDVYAGLLALQHRGQESCGIATANGGKLRLFTGMGLVSEVFKQDDLALIEGSAAIGHVRYSTTGASSAENAQPFCIRKQGELAIGFNGNLTNYDELKKELEGRGRKFKSSTDTEAIGFMLIDELSEGKNIFKAVEDTMKRLDGAYSLVSLLEGGEVIACRDPQGFRPLCVGKKGKAYVVASESCALDAIDAEFVREVEPGECVLIIDGKLESRILKTAPRKAQCMFEYVYFARPDAVFSGKVVGVVRQKLGEILAVKKKLDVDLVIPVPDSGRSAAYGYALASGKPFAEALIKNRYVYRTFIMPSQKQRVNSVRLKVNFIKSLVKGKRIALVDDSIVRGNTLRKIAALCREAGAREVHLVISCPKIIAPCFMGIDFPTGEELIAHNNKSIEAISKELGVDSLTYMDIEGLVEAIGIPKNELCMACLNGDYPVRISPGTKELGRSKSCG
ncbi:Glutamine--fructose-6-phosphate aminotransferase [isomerizing] [Candidatus Gugararchaeum adminiculabundum]|nr:Glutamine--fructose-6-phosphate aminotransferase [isomerizing] [Candidatus Gugararchaeum adminiculabundum]